MNVNGAFKTFQDVVNAEIDAVREARTRRDFFKGAFSTEPDVVEVIASGSLARGTHKDPIHDVDIVVIFDEEEHPDWGQPGASAEEALDHTRVRVNDLLGITNGTYRQAVRLARWRNHAVKCFLDDPDDANAFTVDAMPAFRRDGKLLIPEATSKDWVYCDPESLIAAVARKHTEWNKFAGTVRMLKWWAAEQDIKIKSLVMEVLALDFLPTAASQPSAIKEFFVKASYYVDEGGEVLDPADICGPIQADLEYADLGVRLRAAGDSAARAIQAQVANDNAAAIGWWGEVFGGEFPSAPAKDASPAAAAALLLPRPVKDTPQG